MGDNGSKQQMSTPIKYLLYGIYIPFIAPILMCNYIASKIVRPINENWSIARTIKGIVISMSYLKFLTPAARRRIFIRSAMPTPAQYIDSLPGEEVMNGDTRVERQHSGEHWDKVRRSVYERDDYTCQICGVKAGSDGEDAVLQADHIVPRSRGGEDDMENLRTLCRTCHQARHARLF